MDETPSPASSRNELQKKSRHYMAEEEDGDGDDDSVKCTGKACQSCTAGLIADCVAICCCPLAVVNILAFTFLKIPYMMGRKWLRKGKMKMRNNLERKRKKKRKCERSGEIVVVMEGRDGNSRKRRVDHEGVVLENDFILEFGVEELKGNVSARFEDVEEDVWLELYKIGHLGFGRVSFTGISSKGSN